MADEVNAATKELLRKKPLVPAPRIWMAAGEPKSDILYRMLDFVGNQRLEAIQPLPPGQETTLVRTIDTFLERVAARHTDSGA